MTQKIKVLNLYAGIGGNRKLWPDDKIDVTAVEINEDIAKIYQDFFPDDKMVIGDAHEYLKEHYDEFDFIWSSPPCPTHSRIRKNLSVGTGQSKPKYPDMRLYQEILFLKGYFEGKWVVENVKSWYNPLIKPLEVDRHYLWSNFYIDKKRVEKLDHDSRAIVKNKPFGFDIGEYDVKNYRKDQILRNLIPPKMGLHIYKCAFKEQQIELKLKNEKEKEE